MQNLSSKIIKEILIVFISGCLPIILSLYLGGLDLVSEITKDIMIHKFLLYYTMVCGVLFVIVAGFDHYMRFGNQKFEDVNSSISGLLLDSANTFIGMLRVSGGMLFTVGLLWFIDGYEAEDKVKIIYLMFIGFVAVAETFILSQFLDYIKIKWLKLSVV